MTAQAERVDGLLAGHALETRPSWITPAEWHDAQRWEAPQRRQHWAAARRLAKALLSAAHPPALAANVSIRTSVDGAPRAWLAGRPCAAGVSLAHHGRFAAAAVGLAAVGVDVLDLAQSPWPLPASATWALREAAFKAASGAGLVGQFSPSQWRLREPVPAAPGRAQWVDGPLSERVLACWSLTDDALLAWAWMEAADHD